MAYQEVSGKYRDRLFHPPFGSFEYLDRLIHGPRDSVTLTSDITLRKGEEEKYENGIEFEEGSIIIDGAGHTIDARAKASIFRLDAEVYIRNTIIKNGHDAISNKGAVKFEECCFLNNRCAILNEGKMRVEKCAFTQNRNDGGIAGAIVHKGDDFEINRSAFEANCAGSAGAIFASGSGIIWGCDFRKNQGERAGALYSGNDLKIMNCKFEENRAINDSGAICNRNGDLLVLQSTFRQNISMKGSGAIFNRGNLSVDCCDFTDNRAGLCGGAIQNVCNLKISESMFRYNMSRLRGGAVSSDGGTLEISDSSFTGNKGAIGETIVVSRNNVLKLENCDLEDDDVAYHETYPYCAFSG